MLQWANSAIVKLKTCNYIYFLVIIYFKVIIYLYIKDYSLPAPFHTQDLYPS